MVSLSANRYLGICFSFLPKFNFRTLASYCQDQREQKATLASPSAWTPITAERSYLFKAPRVFSPMDNEYLVFRVSLVVQASTKD